MDFSNIKVLVIGDIGLDIMTNGESTRLSPEAPVPVIKNPNKVCSLGMSGNVALNLKNLGADVAIECLTGDYDEGHIIVNSLLDRANIQNPKEEIISNGSPFPTIIKERIMANGHQIARIDIEQFPSDHENIGKQVASSINNRYGINSFDFVIISDYNKGMITKENWKYIRPILEKVNKSGLFFVDTKKVDMISMYEGMILTPNMKELDNILKYYDLEIMDLMIELDTCILIETASEKGAYAHTKDGLIHEPAQTVDVVDICGCGDTFISAFSLYYYKFKNVGAALRFANYCCSKVAKKKGTTPILFEEALGYDFNT